MMSGQRFNIIRAEPVMPKPKTLDERFKAIAEEREAAHRLEAQRSTAAVIQAQRREAAEARQSQARAETLTAHRQGVSPGVPVPGVSRLAGRLRPAVPVLQENPFPPAVRSSGIKGRLTRLPAQGKSMTLRGRGMAGMFGLGPTRGVSVRGAPRGRRGVVRGAAAAAGKAGKGRGGARGRGTARGGGGGGRGRGRSMKPPSEEQLNNDLDKYMETKAEGNPGRSRGISGS